MIMPKYSEGRKKVKKEMDEMKKGKSKSGRSGKKFFRKQAIEIGLSEARQQGSKVSKKKNSK
jgi:hypothetical protein